MSLDAIARLPPAPTASGVCRSQFGSGRHPALTERTGASRLKPQIV
ncbi:MAG: hypothetical protein QOI48_3965, partial [Solirubrobacteraceae bacterium]|nr:hypothetical protein [Solirubrobacteraceae bacterium]